MRKWIDELSDYIEDREEIFPLKELTEEMGQAALDTDHLLQASEQLQSIYTSIVEKVDHVVPK
jgi:hypothetical protein